MNEDYTTEATVPYEDIVEKIKETETKVKHIKRRDKLTRIGKKTIVLLGIAITVILTLSIDRFHAKRTHLAHPTFNDITADAQTNGIRIGKNKTYPDNLKLNNCNRNGYLAWLFYTDYDFIVITPIGDIQVNQKAIYSRSLKKLISIERITDITPSLTGSYEGTFTLSKQSELVYKASIEIFDDNSGTLTVSSENGKTGKYYIKVIEHGDLTFDIKGTRWINHPTFFMMNDFSCYYNVDKDALMPTRSSEEQFTFTRKSDE